MSRGAVVHPSFQNQIIKSIPRVISTLLDSSSIRPPTLLWSLLTCVVVVVHQNVLLNPPRRLYIEAYNKHIMNH